MLLLLLLFIAVAGPARADLVDTDSADTDAPVAEADSPEADDAEVVSSDVVVSEIVDTSTATWLPPRPSPTSKDWIRFKSGEWLRGNIERLNKDTLYFDSDELDDLEIDWDDIVEVQSARSHTYRLVGREVVVGTMAMQDGVIRIDSGEEVREIERHQLVGLVEGTPKESNYWSGKVSFGLALRGGNTEQADYSALIMVYRDTALTRLSLSYNGIISSTSNVETSNNHRLGGTFDVYLSRRLYVTLPGVDIYKDDFQNIDLRVTPGVGFGYDIIDRKWIDWEVGGGLGYQYTSYVSVEEGTDSTDSDIAVLFSTALELDPTKRIEWDTSYQLQLVVTDTDKTNHHLLSVFSVELLGPLDLDVTFNWDRIEQPQADAEGNEPLSDDYRLTLGIGIDF